MYIFKKNPNSLPDFSDSGLIKIYDLLYYILTRLHFIKCIVFYYR